MTPAERNTKTDLALADIERQLAALPSEENLERQLAQLRQQRETLSTRMKTIRSVTSALAHLEPELATEIKWRDHLVGWRQTLCDELLAFPSRIRDDREWGRKQSVQLSIMAIDQGRFSDEGGWSLETLRLGHLMREAGYVEGPKIENQTHGRLPWFGSVPEVERRIADLQTRLASAEAALDEALMDDAARTAKAAATSAQNGAPQRKTRSDGSQYDRYPDGRVVELTM